MEQRQLYRLKLDIRACFRPKEEIERVHKRVLIDAGFSEEWVQSMTECAVKYHDALMRATIREKLRRIKDAKLYHLEKESQHGKR